MSFLYPEYLWYSLFLLPYLAVLPLYYRKQLDVLHLLCRSNLNAKMRASYRKYFTLLATFFALFILFLVLALAKPLWGYNRKAEPRAKGLQIVFVLDISRSMLARDVVPSRLSRAIGLLGELHEIFEGDELGLVVFKGRAQTLVPLSHDRLVFPSLFPQLDTEILQTPGSNLAAALEEGITQFDNRSNTSQVIILLSDGESLSGDPSYIRQRLDNWDGTLMTIGVGTKEGAELLDQDDNIITNYHGLPVRSQLQEDVLLDLSHRTFGKYYPIQELSLGRKLQNELAPLTRGNHILKYNLRDRYQIFITLALFCFLIVATLKRFGFMGFYQFSKSEGLSVLRHGNPNSWDKPNGRNRF
ncbi:VWA domain-containing protein [Candidatus Haliotispira prima]|uniref:VWA domain-containing protein n=1 Tax=Candidatus Haliotispira prima TaxID=3034016 RepID=A0ABY8MIJ5_9SPIO|nr:VWA domain-containing protein [Candidatus Haliotispira prima]